MSFDLLAPYYRPMETVLAGGMMQRCRTAFLTETKTSKRALVLGEGPGKFLTELLLANSKVTVTCIEQSPRMIDAARRSLRARRLPTERAHFEAVDALQWSGPENTFDLIVTNFFLDCFRPEQIETLTRNIARLATPHAQWLVTDFCVPAAGWQRWRARCLLALMYPLFRLTTRLPAHRLTPPDACLQRAGFRLAQRQHANFGFMHADQWLRVSSKTEREII